MKLNGIWHYEALAISIGVFGYTVLYRSSFAQGESNSYLIAQAVHPRVQSRVFVLCHAPDVLVTWNSAQ